MIKKIKTLEELHEAVGFGLSKGVRTNFYKDAESLLLLVEGGCVSSMDFDGGRYIFAEKEGQTDLYFFLEKGKNPCPLPVFEKPLIMEQVFSKGRGLDPSEDEWKEIGFEPYVVRQRMFLSAKDVSEEKRDVHFAGEDDFDEIFALMNASFEPYTSALPGEKTLRSDLREHRVIAVKTDGKLAGFLRFGRENKISVLWQVAVSGDFEGKGVGSELVKDWLYMEKNSVSKFRLWVRLDNPGALKMYDKSGFLPDGRIAFSMIKKKG